MKTFEEASIQIHSLFQLKSIKHLKFDFKNSF